MRIEEKLAQMGYTLPEDSPAGAIYTPVRQIGNTLYVSGQIPWLGGKVQYSGKLGSEHGVEYGREAARLCTLNLLSAVRTHLGDLDRVRQIAELNIFVSSEVGFMEQHLVANAASQLLVDLYGDEGKAARTAVGVNQLPLDVTVEVKAVIEAV